ncbi:MAG: site-specific integrase, partial [Thaumarchaeota archaeon]|nr:site-specific integrase [Nitrososphaerota archaeon]
KEELNLKPENFDLEHGILTIPKSKSGYKRCKCSKWNKTTLLHADKACSKCEGKGKVVVPQRTTILPKDIIELKDYLYKKEEGTKIWPVTRQTVWTHFKQMCVDAGISYFWQKSERAFEQGWPYLLRSSRAKIMEKMGAEYSLIALKLRHRSTMVTLRYTEQDIHALLAWEAAHYKVKVKA